MTKSAGVRSLHWALWKWFLIPDKTDPTRIYLRRLRLIQTPLFAIYVHWICLPDSDRDPHDHPWNFTSWIVRGGYTERRYTSLPIYRNRTIRRFRFNRVPITQAHRITSVQEGTVSVLLIGRRQRNWGFWTEKWWYRNGWVPWQEYDRIGEGPDPFGGGDQ